MTTTPQRLKLSRLPGMSLLRFESLWMAADHLVVCHSYGIFLPFMEDYRRLFFRDIQAVQISSNNRKSFLTVALSAVLCFFLLLSLVLSLGGPTAWPFAIVFSVLTFLMLVVVLLHLAKGPTCSVLVKTAVQTVPLSSVGRLPEARALLGRLQPLVAEAQTDLPPVFLPGPGLSAARGLSGFQSAAGSALPAPPPIVLKKSSFFLHWLAGSFLILNAGLSLADYFITRLWPTLLAVPLVFALMLVPLVALIRMRSVKCSTAFVAVSWLGIAFSIFILLSGYTTLFYYQIKNPELASNQWELLKFLARLVPGQSTFYTVMTAVDVTFSGCIGLIYLAATLREQRKHFPLTSASNP